MTSMKPSWILLLLGSLSVLWLTTDGRRLRLHKPPTDPTTAASSNELQESATRLTPVRQSALASNDPEGRRGRHRSRPPDIVAAPPSPNHRHNETSRGRRRGEFPLKESSRDRILQSSKDALIITKKNYLKKDWCKTEPLIQKIREEGCMTRTVVNRFCYGQCNSFYIPKNARQDMELTAFKSCAFCKPKRYTWITITLKCPGQNPPYKKRKIQRVKQCRCIAEIVQ